MTNHPHRSQKPFSPRQLSAAATKKMTDYVEWLFRECMSEDEVFPLGSAWRERTIWTEASLIAAAIVYRAHALSDPPYRVIGDERGPNADARLVFVADELGLS